MSRSRRGRRLAEGAAFLLAALRMRPVARRAASGLSLVLGVVGLGMLAYPFATNVFQERLQTRLEVQLASPEIQQAYAAGAVEVGDSLTRLRIPTVDVDVVVVEGTTTSAMRAGAGHYPNTPLPGEDGNVAIAGHRTTYGRPFADLDRVAPGEDIILETPLGTHTYRVSRQPYVVANTDWEPIAQRPGKTLTLTTCHPKGSARQRLVVKAELVEP
ncbi:MAG: class E sortase [Acidimicrobiia bacterium]